MLDLVLLAGGFAMCCLFVAYERFNIHY